MTPENTMGDKPVKKLVVLGPPGAGKGTVAEKLSKTLDVPHVTTGDLLRKEIEEGTERADTIKEHIEDGELVPNRISISLALEAVQDKNGFILDGYPRDMEQAEALEGIGLDAALHLAIEKDTAVERLSQRRSCPGCGQVYNLETNPPEKDGVCGECGETLVHRDDDTPPVIEERFTEFQEKTVPVIEFYRDRGLLVEVNGEGDIPVVWRRVQNALNLEQ